MSIKLVTMTSYLIINNFKNGMFIWNINGFKNNYSIICKYREDGKVVELDYPSTGDKKVDKEIIDESLDPLDDYTKNNKIFNITLNSKNYLTCNNILSILYTGLFSSKDTAYPTNLLYSTNIDLNSKKTVELEDILKINNNLLNILQTKSNIVNSTNSQDLLKEQGNIIKNYTLNELKDMEDNFYLTKESLDLIPW